MLALLPASERRAFWASLSDEEAAALEYDWLFWARANQLPPSGAWVTWLVQAGRGFGKTRIGAEWVRTEVEAGRRGRLALVGETAADARDVMVEGESGLLAISPPWNRPKYEPSKRRLTWPNGAIATTYSADDPEQFRGPQFDGAWADEVGKWHSARSKEEGGLTRAESAWSNLMMGLRLGQDPRCVATSTPRPTPLVKALVKDSTTVITRGTTYDNLRNLSPSFRQVIARYEGTRLGRQELRGELLEDVEGALWTFGLIDAARWRPERKLPDFRRVVVAVDPAGGSGERNDETGIGVAGSGMCSCKGEKPELHYFVLQDASGRYSPDGWARRAVRLYQERHADRMVAEANYGGEMVEATVRAVREPGGAEVGKRVSYRSVHATRGKRLRAEPIAALYEQGLVHHVGLFPELEDQQCQWTPDADYSPDRLDWLVWALTELSGTDLGVQYAPSIW